jgi:CRISPR-associated protein Csx17
MYSFAYRSEQGNNAKYLLDVLCALGRAEQSLANGLAFCKAKYIRPLQGLNRQWLDQTDDESPEFRLAASLAGIQSCGDVGPLRVFLEEVEETNFVSWSPGSTSAVWSNRPLATNLAAVFRRRLMEAFRDTQTWSQAGMPTYSRRPSRLTDVIAFLHDELDEAKLSDLTWGLTAVDWLGVDFQLPHSDDVAVPCEFGIPRLLVGPAVITSDHNRWKYSSAGEREQPNAKPDPDVFHVLASGQSNAVTDCVDRAARRLKSCGRLVRGYHNRRLAGRSLGIVSPIPAERLLASMLFPLFNRDLETVANAVLYPPESEE